MSVSNRDPYLKVPSIFGSGRRQLPKYRNTDVRDFGAAPSARPHMACDCVCTCGAARRPPRLGPQLAPPPAPRPEAALRAHLRHSALATAELENAAVLLDEAKPGRYDAFASGVSYAAGTPWCFYGAVIGVVAWGACGKAAHGSDTWQLVLNTSSSIVTMLMCFILQNTLNRDTRTLHVQLQRLMLEVQTQQHAQHPASIPRLIVTDASDAPVRR